MQVNGQKRVPNGPNPLKLHESVRDFPVEALAGFLDAVLLQLAFPNFHDMPTICGHGGSHFGVTGLVAGEFRFPVLGVLAGSAGVLAAFMLMPETTHDVNGDLAARIGDVGMPVRLLPI